MIQRAPKPNRAEEERKMNWIKRINFMKLFRKPQKLNAKIKPFFFCFYLNRFKKGKRAGPPTIIIFLYQLLSSILWIFNCNNIDNRLTECCFNLFNEYNVISWLQLIILWKSLNASACWCCCCTMKKKSRRRRTILNRFRLFMLRSTIS